MSPLVTGRILESGGVELVYIEIFQLDLSRATNYQDSDLMFGLDVQT